ncbi:MAG TPA: hypothetical protein PKK10_05045 [Woeseiaceae bacterium]|nr:hypothetical protein [Woeseiaceae bacterium]
MTIVSRIALLTVCVSVLLLTSCASREQLQSKSAVVPADMNLSGTWVLRDEQQSGSPLLSDAELEFQIPPAKPSRSRKKKGASLVNVFLQRGSRLKITQTKDGLFVSFDRSVVEEYRFGENRVISVGPVEASRVSGWEGQAYVIETLTDDGYKLVEHYRLENNGTLLVRKAAIFKKDSLATSFVQEYDKVQ